MLAAMLALAIPVLAVLSRCARDDRYSNRATPVQTEPQAARENAPSDEELQEEVRERDRDRAEEQKFDEPFRRTRFDRLIAKLPIRKPPLYVEQYITTSGSHKLYTAVNRKRFLCDLDVAQRKQAVADFYRTATKVFREGGVNDLVQVVTPASQTTEELPAIAMARDGSVSLTRLGRARDGC